MGASVALSINVVAKLQDLVVEMGVVSLEGVERDFKNTALESGLNTFTW